MRYALRNKKKIEAALSSNKLEIIIKSLEKYFENRPFIPTSHIEEKAGDKFKTLLIANTEDIGSFISFYIIVVKYDVVRLAFKEFIG